MQERKVNINIDPSLEKLLSLIEKQPAWDDQEDVLVNAILSSIKSMTLTDNIFDSVPLDQLKKLSSGLWKVCQFLYSVADQEGIVCNEDTKNKLRLLDIRVDQAIERLSGEKPSAQMLMSVGILRITKKPQQKTEASAQLCSSCCQIL